MRLENVSSEPALETLGRILAYSAFDRMWLVDRHEGKSYDRAGHSVDAPDLEFIRWAQGGQSGIYKIDKSPYTQKEVFCVYAPIPRSDGASDVIMGVYELHSLVVRTENPQFEGTGYTHVFDKSGKFIIKSDNKNSLVDRDNIWDFFKSVRFGNGFDYERMRWLVEKDGAGMVAYSKGAEERIGYFAPLGVNDWYMLSSAPKAVVASYADSMNSFALTLLLKVFSCFAILVAGIVVYSRRARARVMRANALLDIGNQRFRVAAYHLSRAIVEYNVADGAVYRVNDMPASEAIQAPIADLARNLIENCVIDEKSLDALRGVFDRLLQGEKQASCIVEARRGDGKREWCHIVFTNIFDALGKPTRSIGTIEDITARKETEIRFEHEERNRQAMLAEVLETFVFNLTRRKYLYGHANQQAHRGPADSDYAGELEALGARRAHADYREQFTRAFSIDQLRSGFERGVSRVEMDFRGADRPEGESWLNCTMNLVVDPETKDLLGYAYIKDITKAKLAELALKRDAEHDPLTGLYNRSTANRLIGDYIATAVRQNPESVNAFFLVDLDRFKYVNDTYGHAAGDDTLRQLAVNLSGVFRKSDIVGRMGGDEFIVFMKGAESVDRVMDKASAICALMKNIVLDADPGHRVSGSVGVCLVPKHGVEIEDIYAKADLALYAAKNEGKDRYKIYEPPTPAPRA